MQSSRRYSDLDSLELFYLSKCALLHYNLRIGVIIVGIDSEAINGEQAAFKQRITGS